MPKEKALLLGLPPTMLDYAVSLDTDPLEAETVRAFLVKRVSHAPSVMLALVLAFQSISQVQGVPPAAYGAFERRLRGQAKGTVWQPGLIDAWPGLLSPREALRQVQCQFEEAGVRLSDLPVPREAARAFRKIQVYWVDTQLRNMPGCLQGPEWAQQVARAPSAAGAGLSKDVRVAFSSCLPSPFDAHSP